MEKIISINDLEIGFKILELLECGVRPKDIKKAIEKEYTKKEIKKYNKAIQTLNK